MGFLIPVLQTALGWLVSALLDEVKDKWANKEIKQLAKDAVKVAESCHEDNDKKKEAAISHLLTRASVIGHELTKNVASELIERSVQRYLK